MLLSKESWLIYFTLTVFLWIGCNNNTKEKQRVIAIVGDETLTLEGVLEEIPDEIKPNLSSMDIREYVQRWINSQVLYQEAKRRKLDERIDLKKEFAKVKRELMVNKLIELALEDEVEVTEEEIKSYYEENKESFILTDDQVHAYHILVNTKAEANNIRRRIRNGETFEAICKEVKHAKEDSAYWDLGYFTREEIIPEISKVIFKMPRGALSLPIKSDFGYHIVKLVDIQKKGDINKLENVKEEIRFKLEVLKKRQRFERFLLQMKTKTKVQTNYNLLEKVSIDSLIKKAN